MEEEQYVIKGFVVLQATGAPPGQSHVKLGKVRTFRRSSAPMPCLVGSLAAASTPKAQKNRVSTCDAPGCTPGLAPRRGLGQGLFFDDFVGSAQSGPNCHFRIAFNEKHFK
jgi:hypothetical protein